jgi:hypothetical protein
MSDDQSHAPKRARTSPPHTTSHASVGGGPAASRKGSAELRPGSSQTQHSNAPPLAESPPTETTTTTTTHHPTAPLVGRESVMERGELGQHDTLHEPATTREMPSARYAGHDREKLAAAARKQHQPETCWATCMAMASDLLGAKEEANEIKWFKRAKTTSKVMKSGRILEQDFLTMAKEWNSGPGGQRFKIKIYKKEEFAAHMGKALQEKHVLLLWSKEHSVVLGAMAQIPRGEEQPRLDFSVLDPAVGRPTIWSLQDIYHFTDEFVVDLAPIP